MYFSEFEVPGSHIPLKAADTVHHIAQTPSCSQNFLLFQDPETPSAEHRCSSYHKSLKAGIRPRPSVFKVWFCSHLMLVASFLKFIDVFWCHAWELSMVELITVEYGNLEDLDLPNPVVASE